MHLHRLKLRNFRNYKHCELFFSPRLNFFQGKNGQGKTNLLEAIYFVSTGRSFRTHSCSDLISFGEQFFYLEAEFYRSGVSQTLSVYYDEKGRKVEHNGNTYATLHSLLGILPSVLIAPNDLSLITGAPSERRRFLDLHNAQTDPLYVHHLGRYFKAMKQRNHLLRASSQAAMAAWEEVMALSALYLIQKRTTALHELTAHLEALSHRADEFSLHYHTSPASLREEKDKVAHLRQILKDMRPKEMILGNTLVGPHRDDFSMQLKHKSAKTFSSEGQKRSCLSSLRFAQWEQMATVLHEKPLLGIDDVGIQLDSDRHSQLHAHLSHCDQVFLTAPLCSQADCKLFTVEKGEIKTDL